MVCQQLLKHRLFKSHIPLRFYKDISLYLGYSYYNTDN